MYPLPVPDLLLVSVVLCCSPQVAVMGNVPRIFTFGIGPWCNHYFLKQLALQGRGMSDVAFRPHGIQVGRGGGSHAGACRCCVLHRNATP